MMSVGTVGLEIILDILGKSILLGHQLGGGESGREIKDMGALRVVFTCATGRNLITLQLDPTSRILMQLPQYITMLVRQLVRHTNGEAKELLVFNGIVGDNSKFH